MASERGAWWYQANRRPNPLAVPKWLSGCAVTASALSVSHTCGLEAEDSFYRTFQTPSKAGGLTSTACRKASRGYAGPVASDVRESASGTPFDSDGTCPTAKLQPNLAWRHASPLATAIS